MNQHLPIIVVVVIIALALCLWVFLMEPEGPELGGPRSADSEPAHRAHRSPNPSPTRSSPADHQGSASETERERDPRGLELILRDELANALGRARVLTHRDGKLLFDERCDEEGILRRSGSVGRASCVILSPGRGPYLLDIELAGRRVVTVPDGAHFAGVIRVDGGLPHRALHFDLRQDGGPIAHLPEPIRREIWPHDDTEGRIRVQVEPDGRFRVPGLLPDLQIGIVVASGFAFAGDRVLWRRTAHWPRPIEDARIDLVAIPRVVGRVLTRETGKPVEGRAVRVSARARSGRESSVSVMSDGEGRFVAGLPGREIEDVVVTVRHGGARVEVRREGVFRDTLDVGNVLLGTLESWLFEVVDSTGAPIEGALVVLENGEMSSPTDPDGKSGFDGVSTRLREALLGARGFRARRVPIVRRGNGRHQLRLERSNAVDVTVLDLPDHLRATSVTIKGATALRPEEFEYGLFRALGGEALYSHFENEEIFRLSRGPDADGVFRFLDLAAGVPFHLVVTDPSGQIVAESVQPALGVQERRAVELRFDPRKQRLFEILVSAEDGRPIPEAMAVKTSSEEGLPRLRADEAGRILVLSPPDELPDQLRIEARGFEPTVLRPEDLESAVVEVVMRKER